jgi:hypothetical protein
MGQKKSLKLADGKWSTTQFSKGGFRRCAMFPLLAILVHILRVDRTVGDSWPTPPVARPDYGTVGPVPGQRGRS